jgi:MerR family transcriptional regulator, heat shock protein HspR
MEKMVKTEEIDDNNRGLYTISVVADLIGVSVHTLRMYESSGLIIPQRTETKRRLYSRADIQRLKSIRILIEDHGLNLAGIKALLSMIPCWELINCTAESRKICDAHNNMTEPCWMVKCKGDECNDIICSECEVYINSSPFTELKTNIFKLKK